MTAGVQRWVFEMKKLSLSGRTVKPTVAADAAEASQGSPSAMAAQCPDTPSAFKRTLGAVGLFRSAIPQLKERVSRLNGSFAPRAKIASHKLRPYYPPGDVAQGRHLNNLNGQVVFPEGELDRTGQDRARCLAFAEAYASQPGKKRPLLDRLLTPEDIVSTLKGRLKPLTEGFHEAWVGGEEKNKQLMDGSAFGRYLQSIADEIRSGGNGTGTGAANIRIRISMVDPSTGEMTAHGLAGTLEVKRDGKGRTKAEISLYDPNHQSTHMRQEFDLLRPPRTGGQLKNLFFEDLLDQSLRSFYADQSGRVILAALCSDVELPRNSDAGSRPLADSLEPRWLAALVLNGIKSPIEALRDRVRQNVDMGLSNEGRQAIFNALADTQACDGYPLFENACTFGHSGIAQPLLEAAALTCKNKDELGERVIWRKSKGRAPLAYALSSPGTRAMGEFFSAIASPGVDLDVGQFCKMMSSVDDKGTSAMASAMRQPHDAPAKIEAIGQAVAAMPGLSRQEREDLMTGRSPEDGMSLVGNLIYFKNIPALDAWGRAVAAAGLDGDYVTRTLAGVEQMTHLRIEDLAQGDPSVRECLARLGLDFSALEKQRNTVMRFANSPMPLDLGEQQIFLADPANWHPRRAALHKTLIDVSKSQCGQLAESMEQLGVPPTFFVLRNFGAAGPCRVLPSFATFGLSEAAKAHGTLAAMDSKNFTLPLMQEEKRGESLDAPAVDWESAVMLGRLERNLRDATTSTGAPASIVASSSASQVHDASGYVALSKASSRRLAVCDMDTSFKSTLAQALSTPREGSNTSMTFERLHSDFVAMREKRAEVMDQFKADPGLGAYELLATVSDGRAVKVATVAQGKLTIQDQDLYKQALSEPEGEAGQVGSQVIDAAAIKAVLQSCAPDQRLAVEAAMRKWVGMTWSEAVHQHMG